MKRIVTVLAVAAAIVAVPAALAGTTQVAGTSTPNPDGFTATMTGSLEGTWVFESLEKIWGGGHQVVLTGTELFFGSVNGGPEGWLRLSYRIETRFDPETFLFIPNGRCQHHVIDSGGGLLGTTGYILMKDRWDANGGIVTTYKGHLDLPLAASRSEKPSAGQPDVTAIALTGPMCGG